MWIMSSALCIRSPGRVWLLFVGVWFWVRRDLVASRETVVGGMSRECIGFHPSEVVKAMCSLGLCRSGGGKVYRERLWYDVGPKIA